MLKRAGLIMAMTAWETYVEDRVQEAGAARLKGINDRAIADFVRSKLVEEIHRLHNPTSARTLELFRDYAGTDLSVSWSWENKDHRAVKASLDAYIKLRGDVVHRSRTVEPGPPKADPVKKDDLEKANSISQTIGQSYRIGLGDETALAHFQRWTSHAGGSQPRHLYSSAQVWTAFVVGGAWHCVD